MAGPLVTIAIPTFNRGTTFLPSSLESACAQTYKNLEILVSDNASPYDPAVDVAARRDARIRYHRHPINVGPVKNVQFCLEAARGEYLVILPDDDLLDPDFVEACMRLASHNPRAGLIRTGVRIVDGDKERVWEIPNEAAGLSFDELVESWLSGRTSPYQCSILFRTEAIRRVGFKSRHYLYDDVFAFLKIAAEYGSADMREVKSSFRLHAGELTAKADIRHWCEESMDLLDLMTELSPANQRLIRSRGLTFLALGNYRRALRKPFPQSLKACWTVWKTHRYRLPPVSYVGMALCRRLRPASAGERFS